MTVVIKAEIVCDKCHKKLDYGYQTILAPSGAEVRALAAKRGWVRDGQRDLCAKCIAKIMEPTVISP